MSVEQISFSFLKNPDSRHDAERIYDELHEVETNSLENKKELIKRLGNIFVIAQIPQEDISIKLTEVIGELVAPRWIREVCAEQKWTRPYGTKQAEQKQHGNSEATADSNSSDSLNTIHNWELRLEAAKEIAIEDKKNPDLVTLESIIPSYVYRYPYYRFFKDTIELFRKFLEEIQKDFDEEKDDSGKSFRKARDWTKLYESIGDMQEYHKALGMLYERASDAYAHHEQLMNVNYNAYTSGAKAADNRQSILPYMYFPILAKLSITTIKHFASKHFALVRAVYNITTKKTTQFAKSPDSISDLLESTMDDAWRWHYIDIKCPDCKKQTLKPKMHIGGTWNFVCNNWQYHGKAQGEEEVQYSADRFSHRINALTLNIGRASQKYLKDRNMAAPEDLRDD